MISIKAKRFGWQYQKRELSNFKSATSTGRLTFLSKDGVYGQCPLSNPNDCRMLALSCLFKVMADAFSAVLVQVICLNSSTLLRRVDLLDFRVCRFVQMQAWLHSCMCKSMAHTCHAWRAVFGWGLIGKASFKHLCILGIDNYVPLTKSDLR